MTIYQEYAKNKLEIKALDRRRSRGTGRQLAPQRLDPPLRRDPRTIPMKQFLFRAIVVAAHDDDERAAPLSVRGRFHLSQQGAADLNPPFHIGDNKVIDNAYRPTRVIHGRRGPDPADDETVHLFSRLMDEGEDVAAGNLVFQVGQMTRQTIRRRVPEDWLMPRIIAAALRGERGDLGNVGDGRGPDDWWRRGRWGVDDHGAFPFQRDGLENARRAKHKA